VIYRIFYTINKGGGGRMTYRELRRSDLLEALFALEREEDINRVTRWVIGVEEGAAVGRCEVREIERGVGSCFS
jgi:hypothetical protein